MRFSLLIIVLVVTAASALADSSLLTEIGLENRYYFEKGAFDNSDQYELNLRLKLDYSYSWDNSRKVFQFVPYVILSSLDSEKTHWDIRELSYVGNWHDFEIRAGMSKVFWGVTESVHLVDIINQTDFVENIDGEDKFAQAMVQLSYPTGQGNISVFMLPFFKERSFAGKDGRLRSQMLIDTDNPIFEATNGRNHIDLAARWEHSYSLFDIGLSHFYGTSRDPILTPGESSSLQPHYNIIHQTGIDVQATIDALLIKHESVYRNYDRADLKDFYTQASGIEYSFYGVFDLVDIGFLVEYLWASEEDNSLNPFDNELFTAVRFAFHDTQSTELLAGAMFDLDSAQTFINIEGKRRLTSELSASLEIRQFIHAQGNFADFDQESYVQIELSYQF